MSNKTNSTTTATNSTAVPSNHDAAAMIISTAITMQNEAALTLIMRNLPGRGFMIVIPDWYFDGQTLSRQPPAEIVAKTTAPVVAKP